MHLLSQFQVNWIIGFRDIIGWFKMHQSQKIYPATSFLEQIYLVMQENAKKVEKSYHLGVPNQLRRLCTVR